MPARETGASFHEIVLLPGCEEAFRRFVARGSSEVETATPLTETELVQAYDAVAAVRDDPAAGHGPA